MKTFTKVIRVLTIAPVVATALLLILYFTVPGVFRGLTDLFLSLFFLLVMPVLAYPLQPLLPKYRAKGRAGQRKLAIITAIIGYIAGLAYSIIFGASAELISVFMTYLLSGLLIGVFSRYTNLKASGHACGIAGPVAIVIKCCGPWGLLGLIPYGLAFFASVKMRRHTVPEYLAGTVVPVISLIISLLVCGSF